MIATHLCVVVIFVFFTISEMKQSRQRNIKDLQAPNELQALLNYLSSQKRGNPIIQTFSDNDFHRHRHLFEKRHPKLKNLHNPNQRNVKNKHQPDDSLENALREESDRLCKRPGRCGCTGGRCGNSVQKQTAADVDNLIDDIQKELDRDQEDSRVDDEEPLTGTLNKYKVNNNVNLAVVAGLSDPEAPKDDLLPNLDDVEVIDLRDHNLEDLANNRINKRHRLIKSKGLKKTGPKDDGRLYNWISPEDLGAYYVDSKAQVLKAMTNYVRRRKDKKGEYFASLLTPSQMDSIRGLMNKPLTLSKLQKEITRILFGRGSSSKILPHDEHNLNVYVPKYMYEEMLEYKKNNMYRAQKRLIPFTLQQKQRAQNKTTKIISNFNWRRNLDDGVIDGQKYGVPFNLVVEGLGQFN